MCHKTNPDYSLKKSLQKFIKDETLFFLNVRLLGYEKTLRSHICAMPIQIYTHTSSIKHHQNVYNSQQLSG